MSSDTDHRDRGLEHLRRTTAKYNQKLENTPTTEWGKAFAELNQIGVVLPSPTQQFVFPKDPMVLTAKDGGKMPVVTATDVTCELTAPGISRVHWPIALALGTPFSFPVVIKYTSGFRGTGMRIENFDERSEKDASWNPGMYRLELDRWRDGQWYVVRNRYKSTISNEDTPILGPFTINSGSHVELRGVLSPDPAIAHTTLIVNGIVLGTTIAPNWSGPEVTQADRARVGVVEGSESAPCTLVVSDMSFISS